MSLSRKYHVCYASTSSGLGSITVNQNPYKPITPEVLDDVRRLIREMNGLSDDEDVVIVTWKRFEDTTEDELAKEVLADIAEVPATASLNDIVKKLVWHPETKELKPVSKSHEWKKVDDFCKWFKRMYYKNGWASIVDIDRKLTELGMRKEGK